MTELLYISSPERAAIWAPILANAGISMIMGEAAVTDPAAITHIACWTPPQDVSRYPNLQVVISTGAGADQMPPLPPQVTVCRTLAPGIELFVRDWVQMAVLMLHRDMPAYLAQADRGEWTQLKVHPASSRRVGILGMGRIGQRVAHSLAALGFPVAGFSRSGTPIEGIEVYGPDQRAAFLARTDLLICLLPLTDDTKGILSAELFAGLPHGALLVHAGRERHIVMDDLRAALDAGQIAAAALDVTNPEPLPQDHWAWRDPRVIVTPHIASNTDAAEGAAHVVAVIEAGRAGKPLPGALDPITGY